MRRGRLCLRISDRGLLIGSNHQKTLPKVNVDDDVAGSLGVSSVTAISRDREDLFLGASTIVFRSITDPCTLEALAVREAMTLSEDLHLYLIIKHRVLLLGRIAEKTLIFLGIN